MDKQVLRELREFIGDRTVRMEVYFTGSAEELLTNCGTAGCMAGYILAMTPSSWPVEYGTEWDTAQSIAKLSPHQAQFLFASRTWLIDFDMARDFEGCKEQEARIRLDVLLDADNDADLDTLRKRLRSLSNKSVNAEEEALTSA